MSVFVRLYLFRLSFTDASCEITQVLVHKSVMWLQTLSLFAPGAPQRHCYCTPPTVRTPFRSETSNLLTPCCKSYAVPELKRATRRQTSRRFSYSAGGGFLGPDWVEARLYSGVEIGEVVGAQK